MARFSLAEQTTLGRHTVVKLMHPELSRDASYVERFRREARLAARLIHHHTAAIYAFGETPDKVLWIAMEYIEGESLHNVLARESPRQIADLLNPVADVLDRAASMGIIHRDVKPDNIMVAPDGDGRRAVLLDFGLARPMEDNDKLTAVGVAVGSPTYMSPEQVFGPTVDAATDRYALGVILYIAVAKRPPFKHEDRVQLVLMQSAIGSAAQHVCAEHPLGHPLDQFSKGDGEAAGGPFPSARTYVEEFVKAMDAQPLPIFGETGRASTSGLRQAEHRPASPPPTAQPAQSPPPPSTASSGRATPPVQGDSRYPATGCGGRCNRIRPAAQQALRSTMPAIWRRLMFSARPDAPARTEPANARSIEGWGARKRLRRRLPISTGRLAPVPAQAEAGSSAQGHRRVCWHSSAIPGGADRHFVGATSSAGENTATTATLFGLSHRRTMTHYPRWCQRQHARHGFWS